LILTDNLEEFYFIDPQHCPKRVKVLFLSYNAAAKNHKVFFSSWRVKFISIDYYVALFKNIPSVKRTSAAPKQGIALR
jgi:hypothetical protein